MIYQKIDLLVRKNQGKQVSKDFLDKLQSIVSFSLDDFPFLDLQQADKLRTDFYILFDKVPEKRKKTYFFNDGSLLKRKLNELSDQIAFQRGHLFFRDSDKFGAWKIDTSLFFQYVYDFLLLDGDTIFFILDDDKAIYITFYPDDNNPTKWIYELILIGDI